MRRFDNSIFSNTISQSDWDFMTQQRAEFNRCFFGAIMTSICTFTGLVAILVNMPIF